MYLKTERTGDFSHLLILEWVDGLFGQTEESKGDSHWFFLLSKL